MARVAIKKTIKPPASNAGKGSPKPKIGRPLGSKNRSTASLKATNPSTRSAGSRKAAPAAPKMNKGELEVQLAKLERTVARLREQNKDLKAMIKSSDAPKQAKPARRVVKPAPVIKTRKPRVSKAAEPDEAVEGDDTSE